MLHRAGSIFESEGLLFQVANDCVHREHSLQRRGDDPVGLSGFQIPLAGAKN